MSEGVSDEELPLARILARGARDAGAGDMMSAFDFNHVTPRLFLSQRACPAAPAGVQPGVADDFDD